MFALSGFQENYIRRFERVLRRTFNHMEELLCGNAPLDLFARQEEEESTFFPQNYDKLPPSEDG